MRFTQFFIVFALMFAFHNPIFSESSTVISEDNVVKLQTLSASQVKGLDEIKKDIAYFHKQLVPVMSYIAKNRKERIKDNVFIKSYKSMETPSLGAKSERVISENVYITMNGESIESIKFVVRRGYFGMDENPAIITSEMESKFNEDPKEIKLKVFHNPHKLGETTLINTYDIDNIPQSNEKIRFVRQYKENVRKLIRELEFGLEREQNLTKMEVETLLKDIN
jgi:hypothetical protein